MVCVKSFLFFFVLCSYSLLCFGQFEGVYTLPSNPALTFILCQEGENVYGYLNDVTMIRMKVFSNGNAAKGRFFGPGWKFTGGGSNGFGSTKNTLRDSGKIFVSFQDEEKTIPNVFVSQRKSTSFSFQLERTSDTVPDRVNSCSIIDETLGSTIAGSWSTEDGDLSQDICVQSNPKTGKALRRFIGSGWVDSETFYTTGYCVYGGKICATDYYENITTNGTSLYFGTSVYTLIQGDMLRESWWAGHAGLIGFSDNAADPDLHAVDTYSRVEGTPDCTAAADDYFNPLQCKKMDAAGCEDMEGFGVCKVIPSSNVGLCQNVKLNKN